MKCPTCENEMSAAACPDNIPGCLVAHYHCMWCKAANREPIPSVAVGSEEHLAPIAYDCEHTKEGIRSDFSISKDGHVVSSGCLMCLTEDMAKLQEEVAALKRKLRRPATGPL